MKFRVPAGTTSISKESDVYAVVDGVVDLPASLGHEIGLQPIAGDADPKAKKAEKADKAEKPDGEPKGKK
jgi:hypothetical protein